MEEIWDSIAAEAQAVEVPEAHKEELDRRLEAYRQNPTAGSSWDDVKRRLAEPSESLK
ncbi:MAG: addiction module protein [Acidobacteriota bacterium]